MTFPENGRVECMFGGDTVAGAVMLDVGFRGKDGIGGGVGLEAVILML